MADINELQDRVAGLERNVEMFEEAVRRKLELDEPGAKCESSNDARAPLRVLAEWTAQSWWREM